MLSLTLMTLAFTIAGSTLLNLAFASIRFPPSGARYLVLVVIGGVAGGALMLLSGGRPLILTGMAYGAVTAGLWACFHLMLFGRSDRSDHPQGSRPAA